MKQLKLVLFFASLFAFCATAQERPRERTQATPPQVPGAPAAQPPASTGERASQPAASSMRWDMAEAPPVQTKAQVTINGKVLRYTASTGRLPIKDGAGKVEAQMFFVAYTIEGAEPSRRPLTFAFNGGPGSASIWLHMGALGPRKVLLESEGWMPRAPYRLIDNPHTALDKTDLVLVDAIGTGFSRPADVETGRKFWSLRGDVEAFGEFIRLFLTRNERWSSPLYLLGESYGTTRAAGVAGYLADRGINFNGIVLTSMVLNFQTLRFSRTNDVPFPLFVPSYTMIAGFHEKLPLELMKDMGRTREEVSQWAMSEYSSALNRGDSLSPQERAAVVGKLARYTGLSKEIIELADLRIDVPTFQQWLLADRKLRVGRLDGRYSSPAPAGFMEPATFDPASAATQGPFTAVFNDYVRRELKYQTDVPYHTSARQLTSAFNWTWEPLEAGAPRRTQTGSSSTVGYPDTATALRSAMVKDPHLKVLIMEGYYDLATPFLAARYTIDHMNLTPQLRRNISYAMYDAGHMMYLQMKSLEKMHSDFSGFIDTTTAKAP